MKKQLMIFAVVLLAVAVAMPALAAVEFKYGGQFRARYDAEQNTWDGTDNSSFKPFYTTEFKTVETVVDGVVHRTQVPFTVKNWFYGKNYNGDDNRRFIDQRLRLYFTFQASKNLKIVTKFEMGDAAWGDGGGPAGGATASATGNTGHNRGANIGADSVSIEVKNVYVEFNIPNTPTTALVGVQTLTLMDSWIVDDDFPAAVLVTALDPFRVTLGYIGGQNGWEKRFDTNELPFTNQTFNVDIFFGALDYKEGPWKASFVVLYQDGHNSDVSVNPATLATPVRNFTGATETGFPFTNQFQPIDNNLVDLGLNVTYKIDWLMAYVNFVKNVGGADLDFPAFRGATPFAAKRYLEHTTSFNYTGWMVDAGATYYCGPYTLNLGGFYTTGPDIDKHILKNFFETDRNGNILTYPGTTTPINSKFLGNNSSDVDWFTYPVGTSKYFSEIIGGGVLGDDLTGIARGWKLGQAGSGIGGRGALGTVYWSGYQYPTNLWTVTAGGSWQICEATKLSASYWYFGTASDVPVAITKDNLHYVMSDSIGHELDFYLDQQIVDGLTLTLVAAYLIANDAFAPLPVPTAAQALSGTTFNHANYPHAVADDAYQFGARLQWNF